MTTGDIETGELASVSCRSTDNPFWQLSIFPFIASTEITVGFDLEDSFSMFDYEPATEPEIRPSEPDSSSEFSVSLLPSVSASGSVCAVCMDEFPDGTSGKQMPCLHVYHESCIALWLAEDGSCPLCRCRISPASGTEKL